MPEEQPIANKKRRYRAHIAAENKEDDLDPEPFRPGKVHMSREVEMSTPTTKWTRKRKRTISMPQLAIRLREVSYTPECDSNFISLGQLRDSGITFHDTPTSKTLMKDGKIVTKARRDRNLFILNQHLPESSWLPQTDRHLQALLQHLSSTEKL